MRAAARARRREAGEWSDDEASPPHEESEPDPPELERAMRLLAAFPRDEEQEEPEELTLLRAAMAGQSGEGSLLDDAGRFEGEPDGAPGAREAGLEALGREAWGLQAERVARSLEAAAEDGGYQPPAPSGWSRARAEADSDDDSAYESECGGGRSGSGAYESTDEEPARLTITELADA